MESATYLVETLDVMTTELIKKQSEGVDVKIVIEHLP